MLSPLDLLLSYIACLHVFEYTIYNTKLSPHNSSSLPPWYTSSRSILHLIGIRCIPPRFDASTTHTILLLKWRIVFEEHCKYWLFFSAPNMKPWAPYKQWLYLYSTWWSDGVTWCFRHVCCPNKSIWKLSLLMLSHYLSQFDKLVNWISMATQEEFYKGESVYYYFFKNNLHGKRKRRLAHNILT